MNTDNPSWRAYYLSQLRRQVGSTHADGAFLDSASVPNEFGGSSFTPPLPDYAPAFERAWTAKLDRWLPYVQRKLGRPVIVNAGSCVTTRDWTNYSTIAGVMVEGFATSLAPLDCSWSCAAPSVSARKVGPLFVSPIRRSTTWTRACSASPRTF
jgi:hypothetical protein